MSRPKVLVTGATGRTGAAAVAFVGGVNRLILAQRQF